jgi:hypothetical protein
MMRKAVGFSAALLVLCATVLMSAVLLVSGPASAQPDYGPAPGSTGVTATTVAPGAPTPGSTGVTGTADGPAAPASGSTDVTATTVAPAGPATAPNVFTGAPPAPASGPFGFTGADLALMFTVGAVAIGVGGMLVLVSRRRRSGLA